MRKSTASDRRREKSTESAARSRRARCPPPTNESAALPASTARGWCPGTRRAAHGDSAPRAGTGCARTRPSARAATTACASVSEKSSTPCASRRVAVLPKRDLIDALTARDSTAFRSRLNPFRTFAHLAGATAEHVVPVDLPGVRGSAVFRGIAIEPLAGLFVLVEEVALDAIEHPARERRAPALCRLQSTACRRRRWPSDGGGSVRWREILRRRRSDR